MPKRTRAVRLRWALFALLVVANLGVLVFNQAGALAAWLESTTLQGHTRLVLAALVIFWNLVLLALLIFVGLMFRRLGSHRRQLERSNNRLELSLLDSQPEAEVLEALSEVSVQFLEQMKLEPLLRQMSETARRILNVDACAIELFSGTEDHVLFVDGKEKIEFGEEIYNRVIVQGKSLLINNVRHHPEHASIAEQNLLGMMVAPLSIRDKVFGLMAAFSHTEGNFSGRALGLLYTFAHHGALLIETTRLMEAVRRLSLRSDSTDVTDLAALKDRLTRERELTDYELGVARRIQVDLLPSELPQIPNTHLEAISRPAKDVGGDFYDVTRLGDDKWAIVIADVAGKGVPAALVTVMSQTVLHLMANEQVSPSLVLSRLNEMLFRETPDGMFVSMFYGIWDRTTRTITFCNAGHEHPILYGYQQNQCEFIDCGGVALGAIEDVSPHLEDKQLRLEQGDMLLLYTDGVIDAKNKENQMFGADKLTQDLAKIVQQVRSGYLDRLVTIIETFAVGAEQYDDITMLCISVPPPPADSPRPAAIRQASIN